MELETMTYNELVALQAQISNKIAAHQEEAQKIAEQRLNDLIDFCEASGIYIRPFKNTGNGYLEKNKFFCLTKR